MRTHWILVANGSVARFFSRADVNAPLMALETMDFPAGGFKDIESERDSHHLERSDSRCVDEHIEPQAGSRQHLLHQFAHKLAQRLEEGLVDGECETFWLIAPSPLLSAIKGCLNRGVSYRLKWTHDADFTALDVGQLEHRLREVREPREMGVPAH